MLAIADVEGVPEIDLRCLPAILHNHPERIAPQMEEAIVRARAEGAADILIGYGDCGTGGELARVAERYGATMLPGAHCYAFFDGVERFGARDEIDAFYLTDFLARHFETFVVGPLKLREHPELRDMMFAHYTKVVHLRQAVTDGLAAAGAADAAAFLGLPLEIRRTGYGDLRDALRNGTATTCSGTDLASAMPMGQRGKEVSPRAQGVEVDDGRG